MKQKKLELLSVSSTVLYLDDQKTEHLMNWNKDTDPRYAGVYWLNLDGVSLSGKVQDQFYYSVIMKEIGRINRFNSGEIYVEDFISL
ncbi:hypothetical protein GW626_06640 [Peribacillus muralis]|uniref:hypothetical protein n=2 Tax=Peribacillus muralis TaxID=264697 RepID=UPI001F4DE39B|nr:hypothetical protein [Peribacillus muralis]MCK1992688.1 hypothetical protein [Peribacillus muralis]MCK2013243.1 hypothetical protein [Peribacillus muralis]